MADTSTTSNPQGPSKSPVLIAVVLVAIVALIGLNVMSAKFRPKSDEEMQQEAQQAAASASPSPGASAPPIPGAGGIDLSLLSPSGVVGNDKAPSLVVVGYEWTPQVQGNPALVTGSIELLQKAMPASSIRVVDVDADPGTPLGISVKGKVLIPSGPDGSITLPSSQMGRIMTELKMAAAGGPPVASPAGAPASGPAPAAPGVSPVKK